ncbi:MAG: hypothetical protein HUU34_00390 [Saprospiraceae bacterium]|jgi:hypothetical protein|nr:hypothetical protein [Saprospiraceae bacterium]
MTSEEVPYTQVKTVLQPFIPALGQAADVILDQEVSAYPVFIVHQAMLSMGIPLIENAAESEWSVNASTLEELVTKQIVQEDKLDVFRQVYKDPRTFLCLLVIADSSADFVFLPR